jgi:cyanophycinase
MGVATGRRVALIAGLTVGAIAFGVVGRGLAWWTLGPGEVGSEAIVRRPGPGGALVICGGGTIPVEVRRRFVALAGGDRARLVLIPSGSDAADRPGSIAEFLGPWRRFGGSWTLLHARSRAEAEGLGFAQALAEASGVWIAGGSQERLAELYAGTAVERQLKALLARGGVVGGHSAGAAVMTGVMIAGGLGDATEAVGFGLLPGAIIDQHFLRRNRFGRLLGALHRHPDLIGFGIDEATALVVSSGWSEVIGDSYVLACLPSADAPTPRIEVLRRGDQANIASLRGPEPVIARAIDFDALLSAGD